MMRWLAGLALLSTLVLAPAASAHAQLLSPGPLSSAHAELEGDTHCSECHASGRGISTEGCFRCHDDLAARVRAGQGLHGTEYRGRSCGGCHVEHVGRGTHLVRWPGGQEHFDHRLTGWALEGGHNGVACARCHHDRNSRGAATFLGARRECRSCHEDPHSGRLGTDCTTCHSVSEWSRVRLEAFDHDRTRFALHGTHQRVVCAGCHGTPPRYTGIEFQSCTSCHQDPHDGRFGTTCTDCHDESTWSTVGEGFRGHHPGLSLAAGHANVACTTCHDAGVDQPPSRGSTCISCHRDPHDAPLGRNCADCHASIRWTGLPRRIGLRAHERVPSFVLRGLHLEAACEGCHDPELRAETRYRGLTFDTCRSCHEDVHGGDFASRDGGECAACHDERGFVPTLFGASAHASTAFPLVGRHEAVPCSGCHQADGSGRARHRVHFQVAAHECADCHENPHGDQFRAEMASGGCAHCHEPAGWDRPHIDHSIFPLEGAHAQATCDACHTVTPEDRAQLRGASYRGLPHDCAGCHDDVHAGQFRLTEPVRACSECHTAQSFSIEHFDHAARTTWPLEGMHLTAPCAGCHTQTELRNGVTATRYRLGYRRCADCHADPHDEHAPGTPTADDDEPTPARRRTTPDAPVDQDREREVPPPEAPEAPPPETPAPPPESPAPPPESPGGPPPEVQPDAPAPEAPARRRRRRPRRRSARTRHEAPQ